MPTPSAHELKQLLDEMIVSVENLLTTSSIKKSPYRANSLESLIVLPYNWEPLKENGQTLQIKARGAHAIWSEEIQKFFPKLGRTEAEEIKKKTELLRKIWIDQERGWYVETSIDKQKQLFQDYIKSSQLIVDRLIKAEPLPPPAPLVASPVEKVDNPYHDMFLMADYIPSLKERPVSLKYPPHWKFNDEADDSKITEALCDDLIVIIKKIARSKNKKNIDENELFEKEVVEDFKTRFGVASTSSSAKYAYVDLKDVMQKMDSGAEFADASWLGIEDAKGKGCVVPSLKQVNNIFVKHKFPYQIDPPHLRRVEEVPSSNVTPAVAVSVPTSGIPMPSEKPICFVAQPFHEPFQGRYDEDIKLAIEAAGMTPYKVDKDLTADTLIDDIHNGIKRATVVLVDITEDNPNVWYELGYSQALDKPLLMISCSTERGADRPYPFDVRGRKIDNYQIGRVSYHEKLRKDVTERLKAILTKG